MVEDLATGALVDADQDTGQGTGHDTGQGTGHDVKNGTVIKLLAGRLLTA